MKKQLESFRPSYNLDPFAVSFVAESNAGLALRFSWFSSGAQRADFELSKLDLTALGDAIAAIEANAFPVKFVFRKFLGRISITVTSREGQWLKGRAFYLFGFTGFSGYWPSLVQLFDDALRAKAGSVETPE